MKELIEFFAGHADIIEAVYQAVSKGTSKEVLLESIRAAAVLSSDAQMQKELGHD